MMLKYSKATFFLFCALLMACSPKIRKEPVVPVKAQANEKKKESKPEKKFTTAAIALLIPFKLDQLNLKTATRAQIERTDMAIDFYQGVKMGIDSAAAMGLNFNVNVYDTRDNNLQLNALQRNGSLRNSNLIIGPVFPEGLKYMTSYTVARQIPIVSPLAASKPAEFNNPNLISIVNNIDQHAEKIAAYIGDKYPSNSSVVVLINPGKTEDQEFAKPLKAFLQQKFPALIVQEFASAYTFETRMMKEKKYAVVICSADAAFVAASIDKLAKLTRLKTGGFQLNLFGHPNWIKQNYNIDNLQTLNTIISTSYFINYKSNAVINFMKRYRANFNFEPSEYAFKGFDIGYYFGKLLARHGADYIDYLTKEKYKGLHNNFEFEFDPLTGYVNKDLILLQYKNLSLNPID